MGSLGSLPCTVRVRHMDGVHRQPSGGERTEGCNVTTRQPSVFLVNPFRDESEMYAEYFAACGWSVSVHDNPGSALASVRTTAPDAIVTRIRQPKDQMDGIGLTATIKADHSTSGI